MAPFFVPSTSWITPVAGTLLIISPKAVPSVFLFTVTVPPAFRLTAFKVEITYVLPSCSIVIFPSVLSILPPAPPQVSDESVVPFCFSVTSFFAFTSSSA